MNLNFFRFFIFVALQIWIDQFQSIEKFMQKELARGNEKRR